MMSLLGVVCKGLVVALALGRTEALTVERIRVAEYLKNASALQEWSCDAKEDARFVLERPAMHVRTVGFVLLAISENNVNESYHAVQCLEEAFGDLAASVEKRERRARGFSSKSAAEPPPQLLPEVEIGVQVVEGTLTDVGCGAGVQPAMYGSLAAQRCFIAVQRAKFLMDRQAPFDVVIVLDTDMFAFPGPQSAALVPMIVARFHAWARVDLMLSLAPSFLNTGGKTGIFHDAFRWLNSGMLLFRKTDVTDRFFGCALKTMLQAADDNAPGVLDGTRSHLPHDQDVINAMLVEGPYHSLGVKVLGEDWQCRGMDPTDLTADDGCFFVHHKMGAAKSDRPTCPLPVADWDERPPDVLP